MTSEKKITILAWVLMFLSVLMSVFPYFNTPLASAYYRSPTFGLARTGSMMSLVCSVAFIVTIIVLKLKKQHENLPQEEQRVKEERGLAQIYDADWAKRFVYFGEMQFHTSWMNLIMILVMALIFKRHEIVVGSAASIAWLVWAVCAVFKVAGSLCLYSLVKKQDVGTAVLEYKEVQND